MQRVELTTYAKVYAMTILFKPTHIKHYKITVDDTYKIVLTNWKLFLEYYRESVAETKTKIRKSTGEVYQQVLYNYAQWFDSERFKSDIRFFFSTKMLTGTTLVS